MSKDLVNVKNEHGIRLIISESRLNDEELLITASNRVNLTTIRLSREQALTVADELVKFAKRTNDSK